MIEAPTAFSMSFECKKEYGLSLYVFNSPTIVESKIAKLVGEFMKKDKKVAVMSNDPSVITRYFNNILRFTTLSIQQRKLLEFNRSIYRNDDIDVLVYPDICKLDVGAISQAKRFCNSVKVFAYCSKAVYEKGKRTKETPYRPFLELAISHSGSQVTLD